MAEPPGTTSRDAVEFLAHVPLFADLPVAALRELAGVARWQHLPGGTCLFRQGDAGDSMAIVSSGRLHVIDDSAPADVSGREAVISTLARGQWVGELALLTGEPRAATLRAVRDSEVLIVPAEHFNRVLEREPELAMMLARTLARQLQRSSTVPTPEQDPDTICVLPLDEHLPIDAFLARITHHLATFGPVAVMGGNGAILQSDGPNAGPVHEYGQWAERLDHLENEHPWVVLSAEDPESCPEWTRFCLRSSDRVLAVTRGGRPPAWTVDSIQPDRCDIVFVGPSLNSVRMAPTIAALEPRTHHHLPERTGAAFEAATDRIARRVSGHALGVVFSGGGARGLAHVGVIERLVEAGAPIDRVGGCSAGAFAAALLATGRTPTEMIAICREELADHHPFTDFTVPREALIKGRKAIAMLTRVFGDTRIEELSLPMFAVSADLVSGELVTHRSGYLRDAIAASMSIPGFAPPIHLDGRLLVDGGLLDNLPVDVMAATNEGPIIAVDVMRGYPGPDATADDLVNEVSRGGRAGRMIRELVGPGIVSTIARSVVLGGWQRAEQNRLAADLLIAPMVDDIGLFEFDRLDDALEAGRRAADEAIATGLPR